VCESLQYFSDWFLRWEIGDEFTRVGGQVYNVSIFRICIILLAEFGGKQKIEVKSLFFTIGKFLGKE
jgi:hypothetical protein